MPLLIVPLVNHLITKGSPSPIQSQIHHYNLNNEEGLPESEAASQIPAVEKRSVGRTYASVNILQPDNRDSVRFTDLSPAAWTKPAQNIHCAA